MSRFGARTRTTTSVSSWLVRGAITPADYAPILWLDAADTATITASSGAVSQWNNKGSLGNFTQATAAAQPTTGTTTVNGLNAMTFDGGDRLTAANQNEWKPLHDGTVWLCVAAWRAGSVVNPATQYALLGNNGGASASIGTTLYYEDSSANNAFAVFITRGVAGAATVSASTADIVTANTTVISTNLTSPSASPASARNVTQINGGTEYSVNTLTNAASTSNPTYALQIGADGNSGLGLVGAICEIVIVAGSNATTATRNALVSYLNNKWAVY